MECKICSKWFNPPHWNSKCCSDECRIKARKQSALKYKQTDKHKEALRRWYKSPARAEIEKRYRSKPETKALAVQRVKRYKDRNPDKRKAWDREYGYRRRNYNAGYFDRDAIKQKFDLLGNKCVQCSSTPVEVDHIIPLSKGGTNHIDNLQPLCKPCNSGKGNR